MSPFASPISFPAFSVALGVAGLLAVASSLAGQTHSPEKLTKADKPDVLLISVDDMNDWAGFLGGYGGKVHTPNMDRLAARGVAFTNAHCPSPLCNPSRTAVLSGRRPSSTGVYGNDHWWRPTFPDLKTIPIFFRENGYQAYGAGKIFHHTAGSNPPDQWDGFFPLLFSESPWMRKDKLNYPWTEYRPAPAGFPLSQVPELGGEFDWGVLPIKDEDYDDVKTTSYAISILKQKRDRPLFLAVGLFRPHLPLYAPGPFFDLYPLEDVVMPAIKEDDLADVPAAGRKIAASSDKDRAIIRKHGVERQIARAYLASISHADAQIGRLLDALDASPRGKNTIIVLWSDHGFHLGEKNHWNKRTLWEQATRVPFIVVAPGVTRAGTPSSRPVNLMDIYPTLARLCGLTPPDGLDGHDLTPLLRNPAAAWEPPSIIEYGKGNVAVRSERYRYIQYSDGSEEFYDHQTDPEEWTNLADKPEFASIKADHRRWATKQWAPPALTKKALQFDPIHYTWKMKP